MVVAGGETMLPDFRVAFEGTGRLGTRAAGNQGAIKLSLRRFLAVRLVE
jgi:hypothetical protein